MANSGASRQSGHHFENVVNQGSARVHLGDNYYMYDEDAFLRERLKPVSDARYDSKKTSSRHHECLQGTRVDILKKIMSWAGNPNEPRIFWLAGMAGTGKSTVAMSVAHKLLEDGHKVASFFFERGAGDTGAVMSLVPTLAFQFASQSQRFKKELHTILKRDSDLARLAISSQVQKLLLAALKESTAGTELELHYTIVIDALDESDDLREIQAFLEDLCALDHRSAVRLKVFLTSRPDWRIRDSFTSSPQVTHSALHSHREFRLHEIDRATADGDIKIFVTTELSEIARTKKIPPPWPEEIDVAAIVEMSAGLFIFAATSCRYIHGPANTSTKRLKAVCQGMKTKSKAYSYLDEMYALILNEALFQGGDVDDYGEDELEETRQKYSRILETAVCTFANLDVSSFALLAELDRIELHQLVVALHAVITISEMDQVQILHESLRDHLVDRERCGQSGFFVESTAAHTRIANLCIEIMDRELSENMCKLEFPWSELDTLAEGAVEHFMSPALRYACLHWMEHYIASSLELKNAAVVENFLRRHAHHYLEAMSLLERLPECFDMLLEFETLLEAESKSLRSMLFEVKQCILQWQDGFGKAPLQIYLLVPYWTPTKSVLRTLPASRTSQSMSIMTEVDNEWNLGRRTMMTYNGTGENLQFSADGSTLVSLSQIKRIEIWRLSTCNTANGKVVHNDLRVQSRCNRSHLRTSSDGTVVALCMWNEPQGAHGKGSIDTISTCCYDVKTGRAIDRSGDFLLGLSPDGGTVAVLDRRFHFISIRDVTSNTCRLSLDRRFIAMSNAHLLCANSLREIEIWDLSTTEPHMVPLTRALMWTDLEYIPASKSHMRLLPSEDLAVGVTMEYSGLTYDELPDEIPAKIVVLDLSTGVFQHRKFNAGAPLLDLFTFETQVFLAFPSRSTRSVQLQVWNLLAMECVCSTRVSGQEHLFSTRYFNRGSSIAFDTEHGLNIVELAHCGSEIDPKATDRGVYSFANASITEFCDTQNLIATTRIGQFQLLDLNAMRNSRYAADDTKSSSEGEPRFTQDGSIMGSLSNSLLTLWHPQNGFREIALACADGVGRYLDALTVAADGNLVACVSKDSFGRECFVQFWDRTKSLNHLWYRKLPSDSRPHIAFSDDAMKLILTFEGADRTTKKRNLSADYVFEVSTGRRLQGTHIACTMQSYNPVQRFRNPVLWLPERHTGCAWWSPIIPRTVAVDNRSGRFTFIHFSDVLMFKRFQQELERAHWEI